MMVLQVMNITKIHYTFVFHEDLVQLNDTVVTIFGIGYVPSNAEYVNNESIRK